jgi:hypothetical protein
MEWRRISKRKIINKKIPKVAQFSMKSAGALIFEPTEINEPAISRIYARIINKNKFFLKKKVLTVFSSSKNS